MDWQNFHGSAVNAPFTKQPVKKEMQVDEGETFEARQAVRDLKKRITVLQEIYMDPAKSDKERRLAEEEVDDLYNQVFGNETVAGSIDLEDSGLRQGTPKKLGDPNMPAYGNCGGPVENVKGIQGSPDWRRGGGNG